MTGSIITLQDLINAQADAKSLELILNSDAWVEVTTRLGAKCYSIATIQELINTTKNEGASAINELNLAILTAATAGAGANGWTDLLVQVEGGGNQRTLNKPLHNMKFGDVKTWNYFDSQGSVFFGKNAGATYDVENCPAAVGIGAYALSRLNQTYAECTAVGVWAGKMITTGNYNTAIGMNSMGVEETGNYMTAVGCDAARNSWGGDTYAIIGADAGRNGKMYRSVAIGHEAAFGNGAAIVFSGTPTTGDKVTLRFVSANTNLTSNDKSWTYTVKAGDTLGYISQGFYDLIRTDTLDGAETRLQSRVNDNILTLDFPFNWQPTVTATVTATGSLAAATKTGSVSEGLVAIGAGAAHGAALGSNSCNVAIGWDAARDLRSGSNNIAIGDGAGRKIGDSKNNVLIGHWAGQNATGEQNLCIGSRAGDTITTGFENIIIGNDPSHEGNGGNITTGAGNIVIGRKIGAYSSTGNGQLNIQGIIWGKNNNATGTNVSTGAIGIGEQEPSARLEVKPAASQDAFVVKNSDGTVLLKVDTSNNILVKKKESVLGYSAGGSVTQSGSNTANVTINASAGTINMASGTIAANSAIAFTVTNSVVQNRDLVLVQLVYGGTAGAYTAQADRVDNGAFRISIRNLTSSALTEQLYLNFAIIRANVA